MQQDANTSFSSSPVPEIPRAPILKTLDLLLEAHPIVVLEGPDGMGKSTILRQFAAKHAPNVVSLSVSAASRWAYDPRVLRGELIEQLSEVVKPSHAEATEADWAIRYSGLIAQLRRRAIRGSKVFYFILDGLEHIPKAEDATRAQILELMPFGQECFKFVMSASAAAELPFSPAARRLVKTFNAVSFFSNEEVASYLADFNLTTQQIAELMRVTQGFPGRVASIRRLLTAGRSVADVIGNINTQLPDLFGVEWATVNTEDGALLSILALATHGNRLYRTDEISTIVGIPEADVRDKLHAVPLVNVSSDNSVGFPAEAARLFVAGKVQHLRSHINELLIAYYNRDPDAPEAVVELPQLFFNNEDTLLDLVEFLSPDRCARIYKSATSVAAVKQQAEMGVRAAEKLARTGEVVRFTFQRATFEEIATSRVSVAEVRARTAIGDYDTALALAEAAPRQDLRLHLLVAMARVLKEHSASDQYDLLPRIRELLPGLDGSALGDRFGDIVSDLFYIAPELAIELAGGRVDGERGENAIDWAITGLAIQAQIEAQRAEGDPNAKRHAELLHEQISDPNLRMLSMHAMAVLGRLSAAEVIAEVAKVDSTGDKLYLLQHWMSVNRTRPDASRVFERGVQFALQATDYTATAKVYRELAYCLPHVAEPERLYELIELLDAQQAVLEKVGPPEDYIRLRLIAARSVCAHGPRLGHERLLEVYNEITRIVDPVVRVACWARLSTALSRVDPERQMDDALHVLTEEEVDAGLEGVLQQSAEHHEVCRGVIEALAPARPAHALEVVRLINTEWRRDAGYRAFIEAAIAVPTDEIPVEAVDEALDRIADRDQYDEAILQMAMAFNGHVLRKDGLGRLERLLSRIATVTDLSLRVRSCTMIAARLKELEPESGAVRKHLLAAANDAWKQMDDSWDRLDAGLEALASLARTDRQEATFYLQATNGLKSRLSILDPETAVAAIVGLMLAIRAFAGVVRHRQESAEDLERLYRRIAECGSGIDQARLYTELALRCEFAGRNDLCRDVVQGRLIPIITSQGESAVGIRRRLVMESAPALYFGSTNVFQIQLRTLDPVAQDEALGSIAWALLNRTPLSDAFDSRSRTRREIDFEQACAVAEVLRQMQNDSAIYGILEKLVEVAVQPQSRINRPQKSHLATTLHDIVVEQLPNSRFIRHDGYRIIADAQIGRLHVGPNTARLRQLAEDGRRIPNTADRAFVLAVIASLVQESRLRRELVREAREISDSIPMLQDRIDRYETISQLLSPTEPATSKELLREALQLTLRGEGESFEERRRSVLSLAYRIDREYAAGLAQISDDDPAKSRLERQLQVLKISDAIAARRPSQDAEGSPLDFAKGAWLRLGLLNAGRVTPVDPEKALPSLQHALREPVSRGYPLFAFVVQNAVQWAQNDAMVRKHVLPLFEAFLRGAELALLTSADVTNLQALPEQANEIIDFGEKERANDILRSWLRGHPAGSEFFIVEPYFFPSDVLLLGLINESVEEARITVLTSMRSQRDLEPPYEASYRSAWQHLSSEPFPETTLIVAKTRDSNRFPIHDRWWLSSQGGVQLGTSYNGIGVRLSTVRILPAQEAQAVMTRVSPYFDLKRGELFDGEKITYTRYDLD